MKVLVLWCVLGVVLFYGIMTVPRGYAQLPSASAKAGALVAERSLIRGILAGVSLRAIAANCMGRLCNKNPNGNEEPNINEDQNVGYNKATIARSLARGTLSSLYGAYLSKKEEEKLYYYVHDGENHIGWLLEKDKDTYIFERYSDIDAPSLLDGKQYFKMPNDLESEWFMSGQQDIVPSHAIMGQLFSTAYPLFVYELTDADGTRLRVQVVARFKGDMSAYNRDSKHFGYPPRYVALITHRDGLELDDHRKYFRVIRSEKMEHRQREPLDETSAEKTTEATSVQP